MELSFFRQGPVKIKRELKEMLLDFTLCCLLDQPQPLIPYAKDYFTKLCDFRPEVNFLGESESIEEEGQEEEISQIEDSDFPEEFLSRGRAQVIYSEPYNPEKDDEDEGEIVFHEKTEEQRQTLLQVVSKCLLFRSLDDEQMQKVIDAMFERIVEPEELVIEQGDDGDNFYIIDRGVYSVYIDGNHVCTYDNKGSFGELALMYNMPRAATVKATTDGALWAMDRQTFRRIVVKAAFKKRKMYEEFLNDVPMLQELEPYERVNLADALIPKTYRNDEIIIKQGDSADGMYFIEKGKVEVFIEIELGEKKKIKEINERGYFGELALVTRKPRAASIVAVSEEVKLAFLDVDTFERLLGPCMDIMKRNIDAYEEQANKILGRSSIGAMI